MAGSLGGRGISGEEFDQQTKTAQGRMEALERELDQMRRHPGDLAGTDLDLLIADVEDSLGGVRRRQELFKAQAFAEASAGAAHLVVAEQVRDLEGTLAQLRSLRTERTRFTERAVASFSERSRTT